MSTAPSIIQKRDELRKKLSQVDRLIGGVSDADRKRESRRSERVLHIPPPADPYRRRQCLDDVYLFLETYMPTTYDRPWTTNQREMVSAIFEALQAKTAQAVAAPRGEGKSAICKGVTVYCILKGLVRFALILASTGPYAKDRLEDIKAIFEQNDLLLEDFPEVCIPARDVAVAPNRASSQETDSGQLTHIRWAGDTIVLPQVDGSICSGAVVMTRGITSSIRGLNIGDVRPDLVIIDDPDDEESADSYVKTQRRVLKINQSIRGLGGHGKGLARVMLCTIINRDCVAFKYTDRTQFPAWNGKRYKLMANPPDRMDLWEEYMRLWQDGMEKEDKFARIAHQFFLDRREVMEAGSVITNPYNFEPDILMDGSQKEVSTLQHCFNWIADVGWDSFNTECQNDPPEDDAEETSGITPLIVRQSLNGLEQGVVPSDTQKLTAFIDIGKHRIHYIVVAWRTGSTGYVVDYGEKYTPQPDVIGTDKAVLTALREWRDERIAEPYLNEDGEAVLLNLCLVDSGFADSSVYQFTNESGNGFMPSMGDSRFRQPSSRSADKIPGTEHWYRARRDRKLWAVNMDPDYWKHWVHDRFLMKHIAEGGLQASGSITLFGDDANVHGNFAKQICAEIWTREWKDTSAGGKTLKEYWKKTHKDNHYFDCMYGVAVAASVCGIEMTNVKAKRVGAAKRAGAKTSDLFLEREGGWVQGMR